jgi:hypothetical protein
MARWLKQSTAATIKLGPFVDDTDGKTAETALTIAQADIRLSKNGGNIAQTHDATGATHDELGYYDVPLDTTDTDTVGRLRVAVSESGALPVWEDFFILPAAIYDWMTAGAAPLAPTTAGRTLDVSATGEAGIDWANVGSPTTTVNFSGTTVKTLTDAVTLPTIPANWIAAAGIASNAITSAKIATGAITSAQFAAGAINAAAIATDAIAGAKVAADAVTKIQTGLATPTNITAGTITTVTNLTNAPTAGDLTATMKASIGTAVAASAVASVTGNVGGNVVGSVGSLTGHTPQTGDSFARIGAAGVGLTVLATQASMDASFNAVVSPTAVRPASMNADYVPAEASLQKAATEGLAAFDALPTAAEIAAEVRDVDNTTPASGSLGEAVNTAASAGDPWATLLPGPYGAGSAGYILANIVADTLAAFGMTDADDLPDRLDAIQDAVDAIDTGGVVAYSGTLETVTSTGGTFAVAPTMDVTGYLLDVTGHTQEIATHTAGQAAFTLQAGAWKVTPTPGDAVKVTYVEGTDATALVAERAAIADKFLGRSHAGGSDGVRPVSECLAALRNKVTWPAGTMTVYATNDTSVLWTAAVTRTSTNPVTGVDPT